MKKMNWSLMFVIGFYIFSRVINLTSLPIFNDEVWYLTLVKKLVADPRKYLWVGFLDGKEPVFFWVWGILVKIFGESLLVGRMLSVLAGLGTLVVFYFLARRFFRVGVAQVLTVILVLSPFFLWYNRLAILDSLLVFWLTLALYGGVSKRTVLLGVGAGLAMLTKSNSWIFLLCFAPIVIKMGWRKLLVAGILAITIYALLVLQPEYGSILRKNQIFLSADFGKIFEPNIKQSMKWLLAYQGWPMMLVIILGTGYFLIKKNSQVAGWFLVFFLPILVESAVGKIYFPRYFLFALIPLLILTGIFLNKLPKLLMIGAIVMILIPNLILDGQIVSGNSEVELPPIERWQYITGWPSGYGLAEASSHLQVREINTITVEPIAILEYGLPYYSKDRVQTSTNRSFGDYYLTSQKQEVLEGKNTLVAEFSRPGGEKVRIYR